MKIHEYNEMMSYLTRPGTAKQEDKKLEKLKKFGEEESSTPVKNNKKPITSLDYINRMQHRYGEAELNESNKLKDAALAAANNNVDPNRPAFSDTDIIFASMDPQEALKFTGGHNKEKIKFMREIKAKVRAQDTYDKKKKSLADMPVRKTPVKDAADIAKEMAIYEEAIDPPRPDFTKRRDPDLDAGIAAILKKKL